MTKMSGPETWIMEYSRIARLSGAV